ncbi:CinA family protein [Mesorhizobium sp. RP14(2022)]|uniref:CinA family protein n=1 Tax=Mesorhizobium liriopis TaxID=2953882 RepID=A0ABT1C6X9_9HYPH|nr:CinA family protein [Mesorhizobium liriopis]MCO6050582.1 CinA family protein [Mesorhizobium liriopis]
MSEETLAKRLLASCIARDILVATAESCTGGMVAAAITDIAGSSAALDRGFVTYSNEAKMAMLGVEAKTLANHGAVSEETAAEMARGALAHSNAGAAVAITGIAGPGGGSVEKPVGLVWFATASRDGTVVTRQAQWGDIGRAKVREAARHTALEMLLEAVERLHRG